MPGKVSGYNWPMNQPAIDTGPDPFSTLRLNEPAQLRIFAGVKRAETVGAILIPEVMAGIVFAVASGCVFDRLVCDFPNEAWIISDQTVCAQLQ